MDRQKWQTMATSEVHQYFSTVTKPHFIGEGGGVVN
jgi:hypothetical protein